MANIDAATPQLKVIKGFMAAIATRDLQNVEPFLSKDFVMKTFPKTPELPDLAKEEYLKQHGILLALFSKVETTFHEVIEAPGKIVAHSSTVFTTPDNITVDYDCVLIVSFVDEDGQLKLLETKDFSDPEKRMACNTVAAKLLAKGAPVA